MVIREGGKNPTLKDIAKVCGVAVPTVSRALTQPERHSPELTARIRAVAEKLGYDPTLHSDARRLSLRRYGKTPTNYLIAFLLPQYFHHSPFFYDVFSGVMDVMAPRGYGVIMIKGDRRGELPACLRRGEVDGAITACNDTPIMRHLMQTHTLKTVVSALEPLSSLPCAIPDFRGGGAAIATWLLARGYKRLIHMQKSCTRKEFFGKYAWIFQGLQHGICDAGFDSQETLLRQTTPKLLWNFAHQIDKKKQDADIDEVIDACADELCAEIARSPLRTAFIAANDAMASVLYLLLTRRGIRVPEDVGVFGFDDMNPLSNAIGGRQISTMRVPLQDCGRFAANLLLDLIAGKKEMTPESQKSEEEEPKTVLVPVTLVEGVTA